jgi:hypothetical protein
VCLNMKETCENCPTFASCQELCEELEKELERVTKDPKHAYEKEVSDFGEIDRYRKIKSGRLFENAEETEINWDETLPQPKAAEINEPETRHLKEAIRFAIKNDDKKFQRRFYAFMRCDNIIKIAKRSGTTKQNIQQQFDRRLKKLHRFINRKGKSPDKKNITPLKFKHKVNFGDL